MNGFAERLKEYAALTERALQAALPSADTLLGEVAEAMGYSLLGGGKRLRAALTLACHGEGTHGSFLGLFDGTLLLSAFLPLEGLDADALAARLLAFSDAAVAVRDALSAADDAETAPKQEDVFRIGDGIIV